MAADLSSWLQALGLDKYAKLFAEQEIDLSVAAELTDQDIEKMGIPLGPRKKLLKAIVELNASAAPAPGGFDSAADLRPLTTEASADASSAESGERRQLTVMFCDLVGSTALSEKLDPEELRSLLHEYRTVCGEVIARYEGFVARYVGDGILTYFGCPLCQTSCRL